MARSDTAHSIRSEGRCRCIAIASIARTGAKFARIASTRGRRGSGFRSVLTGEDDIVVIGRKPADGMSPVPARPTGNGACMPLPRRCASRSGARDTYAFAVPLAPAPRPVTLVTPRRPSEPAKVRVAIAAIEHHFASLAGTPSPGYGFKEID